MSHQIPDKTPYTIRKGDRGTQVWALQRVLNRLGTPTSEDGIFGPQTEKNAKTLQARLRVTQDGIVGPATQGALGEYLCERWERSNPGSLPDRLLWSKVAYESGGLIAAVNWSVAGGVDCGITQRRVYDEDYNDLAVIRRAFDATYQIDLSGDRVSELAAIFRPRPGAESSRELSFRLAILNHNYPYAADQISKVGVSGLSSYWRTEQRWVTIHKLRFPDGSPIRTPLEWCQRYALGNTSHKEPGQAVKLVTSWT